MNSLAFGCADVDELAAAYALGAMETDEARAVADHLAECREPHTELRDLLPIVTVMLAELDSDGLEAPPAALRGRLLHSIATAPQEHRPLAAAREETHVHVPVASMQARTPVRGYVERDRGAGFFDWLRPRAMGAVAAIALIAAVGLGARSVQLQGELNGRDAQLAQLESELDGREDRLAQVASTVAADGTAFRVEGTGGSGYLVEREDGTAAVILGSLADLAEGERYQMWLLTEEELVTAGSFTATDEDLIIVPLDRPVEDFATFAISVETEPVVAPSDDPVMVAALER